MNLEIRAMAFSDLDSVYEIEKSSHLAPWSRNIIHDCILVGYDCRVLEIMHSGVNRIIGYIICRYTQESCHILNLCIVNDEQGKGHGSKLLEAVLNSLSDTSYHDVLLEVRPSNTAALKLYKNYGFKTAGIKNNYYNDAHGKEDAILLKKTIP